MKIRKVLFSLFSTLVCVGAAQATPSYKPEMYIGVQGGFVDTNFGTSTMMATPENGSVPITSASIKNHVFGGRAYLGYQFNEYLALETGFLRPRSTRYTQINDGTVPNGNVSEYGIDISGKVFLPMAAYIHLSPYLKVGGIYMDANSHDPRLTLKNRLSSMFVKAQASLKLEKIEDARSTVKKPKIKI